MENVNLVTIFLTGLLTGGLTCMAVQGGLLAATIAQQKDLSRIRNYESGIMDQKQKILPILSFLIAKLGVYTILGFLLGWFGSLLQLSLATQVVMQIAVGIFMIGTAFNLLNAHPIFRYFVIQPPKFLTRVLRKQSKSKDIFAPGLLGAFTVFIPCGTTQAMMALAIATGNPMLGAAIMFLFVLGTSPVFFTLGYFATKLSEAFQQRFLKVAASAIILLAVFNINNAVELSGSSVTLGSIAKDAYCIFSFCDSGQLVLAEQTMVLNEPTISIEKYGYSPEDLTVKAGSKVKLHLVNNGSSGCTQAFIIPKLGVQKIVPMGSYKTVEFTAPSKPQELTFMCSMGMYRGVIKVI